MWEQAHQERGVRTGQRRYLLNGVGCVHFIKDLRRQRDGQTDIQEHPNNRNDLCKSPEVGVCELANKLPWLSRWRRASSQRVVRSCGSYRG